MELPKYIKDKIRRQNEHVFRVQALDREIEAWCKKVGIDTDSKEFYEVRSFEDGVSPLSDYVIEKLYKSNKIKFLRSLICILIIEKNSGKKIWNYGMRNY